MRTLILWFMLFSVLISCNNKEVARNEVTANLLTRGISLSDKEKGVIEGLKDFLKLLPKTKDNTSSPLFRTLYRLDDFQISAFPYVLLDEEKFYNSPSPEDLLKFLYIPDDQYAFFGKDKEGYNFKLVAIRYENNWAPEIYNEKWEENHSWLKEKLKDANTEEYQLFRYYAHDFYVVVT